MARRNRNGGAQYLDTNVDQSYAGLKRDRLTAGFEDEGDVRFEALSRVEQLLFGLTLPSESPQVIRYNGATSGNPTSAKILMQDQKLDWQNVTVAGSLPADEQMVFLFRNALRSFIYYDPNPTGQQFDYIVHNVDGTTTHNPSNMVGGDYFMPVFSYATPTATSFYQPHGDYFFPGRAEARLGFWCDNSSGDQNAYSALGVEFVNDPLANGAEIQWYNWNGYCWQNADQVATVAGTKIYYTAGPQSGGAYMSFDIKINNIAAVPFTIHIKSGTSPQATGVWCHRSIPNMSELLPIINGVRVNAASVLWTNFSSELAASGKLVSVSVPACLPWSQIAVSQSSLTKLQGYESRQAKTGGYSFLRPDGPADFSFTDDIRPCAFKNSVQTFAAYPLQERSSYVVLSLSVANVDARDTSLQVTHAIEYLTDSKIQEVTFSPYTDSEWTEAIQSCRAIPQHYENKIHFGRIFRKIARIGKKVFNFAKGLAPVLNMIPNPIAQGIGRGIGIADALGAGKLLDLAAGSN